MKINQVIIENNLTEEASELLSARDIDGMIFVVVQAPDGSKKTRSDENPRAIQMWLAKYGLNLPPSITSKFIMSEDPKNWRPADPDNFDSDNDFYNARDQEDGKEEDWYDDPEVDPDAWMDESVTEAGNANSGRRGPDYQDNSPVIPGRVEPLPQGLRHHADASRYGGTEPDDEDDRLLSPQQRHRLHRAVTPGDLDEQEKIAGRYDPDDFDDMIGRLKHLAGAGPLKTVYDPEKRVYKNVPHAVQPAQQPKKAQR